MPHASPAPHRCSTLQVRRTLVATTAAGVLAASLVALTPLAAHADVAITSPGPLTSIGTTSDLNCSVDHVDDTAGEFFGDTACGTLVVVGGTLYGPQDIPAGGNAVPRTAFTPVSQSGRTGSGTEADPYRVVTVVDAGTTGVRITQTDSYVVGDESYRTDVSVGNAGSSAVDVLLYRAGDCYLQNSDDGFGQTYGDTGAIGCRAEDANVPGGKGARVIQWFPLTAGSRYYEDTYSAVWARIGARLPFEDDCARCDESVDNGAGLSWQFTVPAGGQVTQSHLLSVSPTGVVPLVTSKTAATPTAAAGTTDAYTVTITNPGSTDVPLTKITDTLPTGFTYRAGTTTGATTAEPSVTGQTLTWNLSGVVAPRGGSVSLTFGVDLPCTPGTFTNDAGGDATGVPVAPVEDTAPVTITGPCAPDGPAASGLTASSAATQHSDPASLTSVLTAAGAPLAGRPVVFSLAGTDHTATTGADGSASLALPQVLLVPGSYAYTVAFAGDATHAASTATGTLTVAKEDCTLTWTGQGQVPAGSPTVLQAQFGELDPTPGAWAGKSTTFALTDSSAAAAGSATATTDGAGAARAELQLAPEVYQVTAAFPGDDRYLPCASGTSDLVVVAGSSTKVTGGGFVLDSGRRTSFGFNASSTATGAAGQLQLRSGPRDRFHGSTVNGLQLSGTTATWTGTGRWNGVAGATFTVTASDTSTPSPRRRATPDTFRVQVQDASGTLVLSTGGELKGGNLVVRTD